MNVAVVKFGQINVAAIAFKAVKIVVKIYAIDFAHVLTIVVANVIGIIVLVLAILKTI